MRWLKSLQRCWSRRPEFVARRVACLSPSGLHRMAYTEWGDPENPRVLLCVHGLTRNGRDFDRLARVLANDYRVVCPDVVGRGRSEWLKNPDAYAIPQYASDMVTLIARLGVEQVDWLGTSMGGLIGMTLAAMPETPIRRLILNDVGPLITGDSIRRIGEYVGRDPEWDSFEAALAYCKGINATFGTLDEAQWLALTQHTVAQRANGRWGLVYDPGIAAPFRVAFAAQDIVLWPLYDQIACPTLAIRGAQSDLLRQADWQQMAERGPRARLAEIAGVGHAPMFQDDAQIGIVRDFLEM